LRTQILLNRIPLNRITLTGDHPVNMGFDVITLMTVTFRNFIIQNLVFHEEVVEEEEEIEVKEVVVEEEDFDYYVLEVFIGFPLFRMFNNFLVDWIAQFKLSNIFGFQQRSGDINDWKLLD